MNVTLTFPGNRVPLRSCQWCGAPIGRRGLERLGGGFEELWRGLSGGLQGADDAIRIRMGMGRMDSDGGCEKCHELGQDFPDIKRRWGWEVSLHPQHGNCMGLVTCLPLTICWVGFILSGILDIS